MFSLQKESPLGRRGTLITAHGAIETPFFMPVATAGAMRGISHRELLELKSEILLCNSYHFSLRPGVEVVEKAGGLHEFIGWQKPILTDSGGYQVFSLRHTSVVDDRGVEFRNHLDGNLHFLGPEEATIIQHKLSADMIMCFDECPPSKASRGEIERAVDRTLRWAKKCKEVHEHLCHAEERRQEASRLEAHGAEGAEGPLLFGIVQGGLHFDLRKKCTEELIAIGFDGYAIGGLAVGESPEEMEGGGEDNAPFLPKKSPRHLMGVGEIEQLRKCIALGMDMFDCVLPVRIARHGKIILSDESTINITKADYAEDYSPIDPASPSLLSHSHSKSYLRHLFHVQERYAETIAIMQNLGVTLKMMRDLQEKMNKVSP